LYKSFWTEHNMPNGFTLKKFRISPTGKVSFRFQLVFGTNNKYH